MSDIPRTDRERLFFQGHMCDRFRGAHDDKTHRLLAYVGSNRSQPVQHHCRKPRRSRSVRTLFLEHLPVGYNSYLFLRAAPGGLLKQCRKRLDFARAYWGNKTDPDAQTSVSRRARSVNLNQPRSSRRWVNGVYGGRLDRSFRSADRHHTHESGSESQPSYCQRCLSSS